MTQKTNQFNLTTQRYTEGDINEFIKNNHWVHTISVKDKFGDSGITGLIINELDHENKCAYINTLLLSCRILGKSIEDAFVYHILQKLKEFRILKVYAKYIPTPKNSQVCNFYQKIGFEKLDNHKTSSENFEYILNLKKFNHKKNELFKITEK